jgi:hypothetical protein
MSKKGKSARAFFLLKDVIKSFKTSKFILQPWLNLVDTMGNGKTFVKSSFMLYQNIYLRYTK